MVAMVVTLIMTVIVSMIVTMTMPSALHMWQSVEKHIAQ